MAIKMIFDEIKEGQKKFTDDIALIVNSILLSLVYVIGVGVTYLISKVSKKNFLDVEIDKNKQSYWEELNLQTSPREEYLRQF